jgi:hypothetical protein
MPPGWRCSRSEPPCAAAASGGRTREPPSCSGRAPHSAVGTLTLVDRSAFPDETVWSHFGQGYGFLPLVLPVAALAWLLSSHVPRSTTFLIPLRRRP